MLPIVIVDDTAEDIALAVRVLRHCKILNPVVTLTSGQEAINYFEGVGEHARRTLPCLLFLDLAMSPISGVSVLSRVKSNFQRGPSGGSVAVMLSGVQDLNLVNQGYKLGATTFLIKPLKCEDLMQLTTSIRGVAVEQTSAGYIVSLDPEAKKRAGR